MTKSDRLYENLKNRAIDSVPGQPFVSFRNIMRAYSVSQATVTRATRRLVEEGLLRRNAGKEMEITEEVLKYRSGAAPVICLALPHWQSEWYSLIEHNFFDQADVLNYELEIFRYDWRLKVPHQLPATKIDAMVLMSDVPQLTAEELRRLDAFGIPYTFLARNLSGLAVNCVGNDDEYAGAQAAHHLIKLGHTSLAVVISQPKSESINCRIKGFRQFCELHSIDSEIIDCGIVSGDVSHEKVYHTLKGRFSKGKPAFTGVFSLCDISAFSIYRACYEYGLHIPEDLSVVCVGQSWQAEYMQPPLTTVGSDVPAMVREAVKVVTGAGAHGLEFIQRKLKPTLIQRGSSAPRKRKRIAFES